jgi:hypothetical protein
MSDEKNTPIWKKEISFRRKPDEGTAESAAGSASLWKKELSFGKKGNGAEGDGVSGAETEAVAESEASLETVDLDLIARYAPLPEAVAPPAPLPLAPEAEARIETPSPIEHDWLTKPLEEVSSPPEEPLALVPDLLPDAPASPISLVPPVEEPAPNSFEPAFSVEPVTPPEPLVAAEPVPVPVPVAVPDFELDLDLPPAPVVPDLPPAAAAPELELVAAVLPELPSHEVVDSPVAVPELEVEDAVEEVAAAKVPFYKKDFSLKRGSSEPKPKKPKKERKPRAWRRKAKA